MHERARTRYNYALTLRHIGRNEDALSEMLKAHEIDPRDPGIVQAVAIFYIQEGEWSMALPYAQNLVKLLPGDPQPEQMVRQIQQEISQVP